MTTQDYPDYNPHPHMAQAQYNQRIPLARNATPLGNGIAQVLAASSNTTLITKVPFDQPAFEFVLISQGVLGSNVHPFSSVTFTWFNTATGAPIADRTYNNANGNGQGNRLRVQGPIRGDTLTILLINDDFNNALTYNWALGTISHILADDDVANDGNIPVAGFTLPGGAPDAGVIAVVQPTTTPATPQSRLLVAFNRRCKITVDNTGQANACKVVVGDPDPGIPLYGAGQGAQFWNSGSVAAGAVVNGEYQMPNGPALLTVTNLGGAGNIAPLVTITAVTQV